MGLFGSRKAKGITRYELEKKHLHSRLRHVLPHGSTGDRKMAALDTAFELALDPDVGSARDHEVMQADEFHAAITGLVKGKILTEEEGEALKEVAKEDLED